MVSCPALPGQLAAQLPGQLPRRCPCLLPSTYAGRSEEACCTTCGGNDALWPPFACPVGALISGADTAAAYDISCCDLTGVTCSANAGGPDFECRAGALISAASTTAGYDISACCSTCAGNADPADDHACSSGSLVASAASVESSSDLLCCDCPLCTDTQALLVQEA